MSIEIECVLVFFGGRFFMLFVDRNYAAAQFCREPSILKVIFIMRRYDGTQLNPIKWFFSFSLPSDSSHNAIERKKQLNRFFAVDLIAFFLHRCAVASFMHDTNLKSI